MCAIEIEKNVDNVWCGYCRIWRRLANNITLSFKFLLLKICQYCVNKIVDCAVCLLNPVILLALVIFQTKPPHCWTEHFVKKIAMTRVSHWLTPCKGINTFILLLQAYGIVSFLFATFPYCFCSGFVSPIVLNLPIDDAPILLFILHFQFRNYKKPQNF